MNRKAKQSSGFQTMVFSDLQNHKHKQQSYIPFSYRKDHLEEAGRKLFRFSLIKQKLIPTGLTV